MRPSEVAFDAISLAADGYRVAVQAPTKTQGEIFDAMADEIAGIRGVKLYRAHGCRRVLLPAMHPIKFITTPAGLRGLTVDVLFTVDPEGIDAVIVTNASRHPDPIRGLS